MTSPTMGFLRLVALVLGLFCLAAPPALADLFGKKELYQTDLRPFPKWLDLLERYRKESSGDGGGNCRQPDYDRCRYKVWDDFVASLAGMTKQQHLGEVNRFFNKFRYTQDMPNWGKSDYWATPGQFLVKSGDCEDYAIAKYMTLKRLGWSIDDMRIIVLQDMNLNLMHAILGVRLDGTEMILDNQIAIVTDARRIRHYRPIYAVNENGWWRFF